MASADLPSCTQLSMRTFFVGGNPHQTDVLGPLKIEFRTVHARQAAWMHAWYSPRVTNRQLATWSEFPPAVTKDGTFAPSFHHARRVVRRKSRPSSTRSPP